MSGVYKFPAAAGQPHGGRRAPMPAHVLRAIEIADSGLLIKTLAARGYTTFPTCIIAPGMLLTREQQAKKFRKQDKERKLTT